MNLIIVVSVISALGCVITQSFAETAGPYTPEQVYSVLYDAIRKPLNIQYPYWLSLTVVGTVADANDKAAINDLANFCPPASPTISAFAREPKLDAIYERVIYGMVGPKREYSPEYTEARAVLVDNGGPSTKYAKYREYEDKYVEAFSKLVVATNAQDRNTWSTQLEKLDKDWKLFGYKEDITKAMNVIEGEEYRSGETRTLRRRNILSAYQKAGIQGNDLIPVGAAPFRSPASELSPSPDKWSLADGWVTNSYSNTHTQNEYSRDASNASGFGGFSLGFVTFGGSGGGGSVTESRVNKVYKFNYEFQLKRIRIMRPWLDTSVFFEPKAWTWKKLENTKQYPRVSISRSSTGLPIESGQNVYDNKRVAFALLPEEFVIARGLRVEATVNKSDYDHIDRSGSAGGGGSLFGIFGGGGRKTWNSTKTSETADTVTFLVESSGISIIGLISQALPVCPDPNLLDKWSDTAWLP